MTPGAIPVFLCNDDDEAEQAAVRAAGLEPVAVPWPMADARADYPRKMNFGYRYAQEVLGAEWVFLAADDVAFHGGWWEICQGAWDETGVCVIGTNDLGNPRTVAGNHSTHTLVHADYVRNCGGTIDGDPLLFHEGYWHNFCDDEFIRTAMARGSYTHAHGALVEHLHPNWRKAQDDPVYQRGLAHWNDDSRLYESRTLLWAPVDRPWRR